MSKICFALLLFIGVTASLYSQERNEFSDFEIEPRFRSVQIDASTIIFVFKIGACVDFDIASTRNKKGTWHAWGFRLGTERIWAGTPGGNDAGSPFQHINGYFRFSTEGKAVRLDFYGGVAYQNSSNNKDMLMLKAGFDFKIKIIPYTGLLINGGFSPGQNFGGIGLYISYQ
jgi:hypothetical protein